MPRVTTDPMDASNRRVTLIVQWVEVPGGGAGSGNETAEGATIKPEPQGAPEQSGGKAAGAAKAPALSVAAKPSAMIVESSMMDRLKQILPGKKKPGS
jgi:hypothetical protein